MLTNRSKKLTIQIQYHKAFDTHRDVSIYLIRILYDRERIECLYHKSPMMYTFKTMNNIKDFSSP